MSQPKTPKMILFDYGGTILNEPDTDFLRSEQIIFSHVISNPHHHTAEELNNWENNRFQSLQPVRDLDAELTEMQLLKLKYELFGIGLDITYGEAEWLKWSEACPMTERCRTPHIEELLRFLDEAGIRTGVISNIGWSGASLSRRIKILLPDNHFEFILASSDYGIRKPHSMLFQVALQKAGLEAGDVWYCGDTFEKDVIGAHASGIFPVYYRPVHEDDDTRPAPPQTDFTYLTVNDWQELIDRLG